MKLLTIVVMILLSTFSFAMRKALEAVQAVRHPQVEQVQLPRAIEQRARNSA